MNPISALSSLSIDARTVMGVSDWDTSVEAVADSYAHRPIQPWMRKPPRQSSHQSRNFMAASKLLRSLLGMPQFHHHVWADDHTVAFGANAQTRLAEQSLRVGPPGHLDQNSGIRR